MSGFGNRARAGAIAFTLGAAVFGPQALGVAGAAPADAGSATASEVGAPDVASAGSPRRPGASRREASAPKGSRVAAKPASSTDSGSSGVAAGHASVGARRAAGTPRGTDVSNPYRLPAAVANVGDAAAPISQSGASSAIADAALASSATGVGQAPSAARAGVALASAPSVAGTLAGMLSGLGNLFGLMPGSGGFADVVIAGLDALRRQIQNSIFGTAPTAAPRQWAQTSDKLVFGTVGATDAEGNNLAYTVMQAPQNGSVELGSDGTYVYTPQSAFIRTGGTDTFTVGVTETGLPNDFGIFSFFARTTPVAVTVTLTPSRPLLSAGSSDPYTTAFHVYNFSPQTLVYAGEGPGYGGNLAGGPAVGTQYQAGQEAHFEVPREFMSTVKSLQKFDLVDTATGATSFQYVLFETNGWTGSTSATCFGGTATCESAGNDITILDPVGTTYNLNSDQAQAQAAVLDKWCDSGPATCTYTSGKLVKGVEWAPEFQGSATYTNQSATYSRANPLVMNPTEGLTQTKEYSVGVSATIEAGLLGVASIAISAQYGQSWSESRTLTNAVFYNVYAPPAQLPGDVTLADGTVLPKGTILPKAGYPGGTYRAGALWVEAPVNRAYMDAVVTYGNTTWNLNNLWVDFPDTDRQVKWIPRLSLVLGGDGAGNDPTVTLPDGGLFNKPTTLVLPKGTTFLGDDVPPDN